MSCGRRAGGGGTRSGYGCGAGGNVCGAACGGGEEAREPAGRGEAAGAVRGAAAVVQMDAGRSVHADVGVGDFA